MSILYISDELSRKISTKSIEIRNILQYDIDNILKEDNSFQSIITSAKKILEDNHYVVIKNIGFFREKSILEAFIKQFGNYYGEIEYTDIKLDCFYTGCNYKNIELHNDDAIDLETQPLYGFIQVINEDPIKLAKNGIVRIDDMIRFLKVYDNKFLKKLFETKIPMLSKGINYNNNEKKLIEIKEPLLYNLNSDVMVRFDLTRIKYYYKFHHITQSKAESFLIDEFLRYAKQFKKEYYLEKGDILIHNNKKCLHDRSECSLKLNIDGSIDTRKIFVSFAR